ncbi:MAG: D-amino acid aminotransferase [Ruminococcaceae bacterium]|nr:D-amino acid aminotransferase [Oscillospiraceae bacterium]
MKNLGYYNGRYDLIENMTVPMNDRACFFGDGLYEAAYARNYKVYALDEHIDRLFDSAEILGIVVPHTKEELKGIILDLVTKLDSGDQLVYFQVSRGTEMRNHAPSEGLVGNMWITLKPAEIRDVYKKIKLITYPDTRYFHCNMKTLNLLPSVLASKAAVEAGADEAVFHRDGTVTECAHSNIAIIREDGALMTAPVDNRILPGVARAHLISACKEFSVPVIEEHFSLEELRRAAEIIVVASGSLCRSACELDGAPVGGGAPEILKMLQDKLLGDYLAFTDKNN